MKLRPRHIIPLLLLAALAFAIYWFWLLPNIEIKQQHSLPRPDLEPSNYQPQRLSSSVRVPVLIPLDVILAKLEEDVDKRFEGEEKDVAGNLLRDDRLRWWLERGDFSLSVNEGKLRAEVPLVGQAKIKGKALIAPVSAQVDLQADLSLSLAPELLDDWRVEPHWQGDIKVHKADIPILGTHISVKNKVQKQASKAYAKALDKQALKLKSSEKLAEAMAKQWRKLYRQRQISEQPPVWMLIEPSDKAGGLQVEPFSLDERGLHFGLGLQLDSAVALQEDAPSLSIRPLPDPKLEAIDQADLSLNLVGDVSLSAVQDTLRERFLGQTQTHAAVSLRLNQLSLYSSGQRLLIELALRADYKRYAVDFNVFLWASPSLEGETLSLKDLKLGAESESLIATQLLWLAESLLLDELIDEVERKASYDLGDTLAKAKLDANEALQNLLSDLPQRSTLSGEVKSLVLEDLNLGSGRLWFTLRARTQLQGELILDSI